MILEKAIAFAAIKHADQVDRAGAPYILHPLAVMEKVAPDLEAMVVAVLHDVLEDTDATYEDLVREFGVVIADAVLALSRRKDETYFESIRRAAKNPLARKVKPADIEHNSDPTRLRTVEDRKWSAGMVKNRYAKALMILKGEVK